MDNIRLFDLNIERILEAWENPHAVRELIANALDEQTLTGTQEIQVAKAADGTWTIRDYGRGLRYDHFTQNENPEKLANVGKVIGKFGIGLKDALATLERNRIGVEIESAHGLIRLKQKPKHGFNDVVTLHAAVFPPTNPSFVGTAVRLRGLASGDMEAAKDFFLKFSGEAVVAENRIGQILEKRSPTGKIYVAGLLIAEEENFVFSYNITALSAAMRKALNRERTNVGRTAYVERVKSMLMETRSDQVVRTLARHLAMLASGNACDEVAWTDVAVHAAKLLNAEGSYLFVTADQAMQNNALVNHANGDGITAIVVPENVYSKISGMSDLGGSPIRDINLFREQWNDSFVFSWVYPQQMAVEERAVFSKATQILYFLGGVPDEVREIKVSNTMRLDSSMGTDALGIWDPASSTIVIRRDQLSSVQQFASVLLHEIAHVRSRDGDCTFGFERELTALLGIFADAALNRAQTS